MTFPNLSEVERSALEDMAIRGPLRDMPASIRGRLALYRLIDEKPDGWAITALGRQALQAVPAIGQPETSHRREVRRAGGGERHYGKKARDTSWFS